MKTNNLIIHNSFIHNSIANLVEAFALHMGKNVFPQVTEIVIGTYSKSLAYYENQKTHKSDLYSQLGPFLTIDPTLDFEPTEPEGRFYYNYPGYSRGLTQAIGQYGPILYDDGVFQIAPVINRYKGNFEVIVWCSSIYQYLDYRTLTYQIFGNTDRINTPFTFANYMAIPEEIFVYEHENPYTKKIHKFNWSESNISDLLFKATNTNQHIFTIENTPWLKLTGINDASQKYGGDDLSSYKLNLNIEWECNLPMHMLFMVTDLPSCPYNSAKYVIEIGTGVSYVEPHTGAKASNDFSAVKASVSPRRVGTNDYSYNDQIVYSLTQSDCDSLMSGDNVVLDCNIPYKLTELIQLKIFSKFGELASEFEFCMKSNDAGDGINPILMGATIGQKAMLKAGDLFTCLIYDRLNPEFGNSVFELPNQVVATYIDLVDSEAINLITSEYLRPYNVLIFNSADQNGQLTDSQISTIKKIRNIADENTISLLSIGKLSCNMDSTTITNLAEVIHTLDLAGSNIAFQDVTDISKLNWFIQQAQIVIGSDRLYTASSQVSKSDNTAKLVVPGSKLNWSFEEYIFDAVFVDCFGSGVNVNFDNTMNQHELPVNETNASFINAVYNALQSQEIVNKNTKIILSIPTNAGSSKTVCNFWNSSENETEWANVTVKIKNNVNNILSQSHGINKKQFGGIASCNLCADMIPDKYHPLQPIDTKNTPPGYFSTMIAPYLKGQIQMINKPKQFRKNKVKVTME